jgi:hypothetical protein
MVREPTLEKIFRNIHFVLQRRNERSRNFLLLILILTLMGCLWGAAGTWAQIVQGPVAEKRLDPTSVGKERNQGQVYNVVL